MKSIRDITIEDVQDLFDSVIYSRGEEYFESGCVRSIEPLDSSTISGTVVGNQKYKVSVSLDHDGDLVCECTCPCDFNCKHAAALLLKWLSIKDATKHDLKTVKSGKKESIEDMLAKKSKDELIEVLKEAIATHPELKSLVRLDRKEMVARVRELFSDFEDWTNIGDVLKQLDTILQGIKKNKSSWDKELVHDMETCSAIITKWQENVDDDGEFGEFLEEWFLTLGEVFASTKPTKEEKRVFIQKVTIWIKKDDCGVETGYDKALVGMCSSKDDIALIQEIYRARKKDNDDDDDYYQGLYLELYDKLGLDEDYMSMARKSESPFNAINKLISLNRLEEALAECEKHKTGEDSEEIQDKKIEILTKLGRKPEQKKLLLAMVMKTGELDYALKLKKESTKTEWDGYKKKIVLDAKKKNRNSLLSRLYYHEQEYKDAYEHSKGMQDANYLELLAKKLSTDHPLLACGIFEKLCFVWINSGSGWPYKKAGHMLEAIKKLDKKGDIFNKTKAEIIRTHKKKYSLMEIIEKV